MQKKISVRVPIILAARNVKDSLPDGSSDPESYSRASSIKPLLRWIIAMARKTVMRRSRVNAILTGSSETY